MYRMRAALLTATALGCLTLGCAKKTGNDQTLVSTVQAKLYADPTTKAANVNVAASNGVVTLSGDVPSSDVELEAMKIANGTAGVASVNDQMKVNPSLAANQPEANQPAAPAAAPPQPAAAYPSAPSAPAPATSGRTERERAERERAERERAEHGMPPAPNSAPGAPYPPARPAVPAGITIPAGSRLSVRMIDSIDSRRNTAGQVFRASLAGPLVSGSQLIVPAGAPVSVVLAAARDAGRIKGQSELEVRLSSLAYHGRSYPINSSIVEEQGKARGKQTAVRTGVGAAAGAVIGAIAGGGKGAAIGSAAGGGAGLGYDVFTHGQQVRIPSESVLNFRLQAPLTLER